ncbi:MULTISPECIES: dihydrofolate reductase family protein [unclassified Pseudomonas]|uniref:dihydrofolate reductase family protein n=1 Tax=unclassified Pseudomonas TaxID=196821 RepID=UPI00244757AD|nr:MULTISPECIES: dihydrofolate reductase family protein [unclassified Pseudomonas]MDG9922680.1 dihydrofolate reductase family protein [Pseudomonas sp. GD04045]MDH0033187.1 dihydrofolate reductase family protein [Pseudomonas sp. GD04019]
MKPALIYHVAASLDGYIARPDGQVDWLSPAVTDDSHGYAAFYQGIDGLLMGRATYDMLRGLDNAWPYAGKPCLVLARNPLEAPPSDVDGRHCTPIEALEELAARGCKRVWLVGGGSLAGNCLAAGLLDELLVNIVPYLLGAGIPLFATGLERRLRLRGQQSLSSGVTQLHYQVLAEDA